MAHFAAKGMKAGGRPHPNPLPEGEGTGLPWVIFMVKMVVELRPRLRKSSDLLQVGQQFL